jgi:hypothetical protein
MMFLGIEDNNSFDQRPCGIPSGEFLDLEPKAICIQVKLSADDGQRK